MKANIIYKRVVPYIGTWIETNSLTISKLHLKVVPYIGTWIETWQDKRTESYDIVVPYIGTWIETRKIDIFRLLLLSYLI